MEKFRKVLKKRIILFVVVNVVFIAAILISGVFTMNVIDGEDEITSFIRGFQVGIYIGVQCVAVFYIVKYIKAFKNETLLKKLYYEEQDERSRLIQDKIGGLGINIAIVVIAIATVIAGFYNYLIFITLLCTLIVVVLIKGVLKVYYNRKY